MDYIEDITIDPEALDVEWLRQAALTFKYTAHAAQTRADMDYAREKLDLQRAELDKKIRNSPEAYGITKMTEGALQSVVLANKDYQYAAQLYNNARFENEMAQAAIRAIQDKKTALENLVRLHASNYFAGPKVPRDLGREWQEQQATAQVNKNIQKKLIRRNK